MLAHVFTKSYKPLFIKPSSFMTVLYRSGNRNIIQQQFYEHHKIFTTTIYFISYFCYLQHIHLHHKSKFLIIRRQTANSSMNLIVSHIVDYCSWHVFFKFKYQKLLLFFHSKILIEGDVFLRVLFYLKICIQFFLSYVF